MFVIFKKKFFLVDYLHGLIDIHNHILPGIDDGAKTVDKSIQLINGFNEFGMTNFVCTPHIMNHYYPNTPKIIGDAYKLLRAEVENQGLVDIKIDYAAEHMVDDNFENLLETNDVVFLKDNYILIEMSFLQESINFDVSVEKIKRKGVHPILAHPERYNFIELNSSKYYSIKNSGVRFQMNLLSLGNYYEKNIMKKANFLLENNLIDYVASDAHNLKQIEAMKKIVISRKTLNLILPVVENTIQTFY